jgi:chloramphenicol O-acetyltransferase
MCRENTSLFKSGKNNGTSHEDLSTCTIALFTNLPWLSWKIIDNLNKG